jgi:hypothetical protein
MSEQIETYDLDQAQERYLGVLRELKVGKLQINNTYGGSLNNPYEKTAYFKAVDHDNNLYERFTVRLTKLPGCCGMLVLHDPCDDWEDIPKRVMETFLDIVMDLVYHKANAMHWGRMVVATTIGEQRRFARWLRSRGFIPLGVKSKNPRTDNNMTLWGKNVTTLSSIGNLAAPYQEDVDFES